MPAYGGKMGIDATRKLPAEGATREFPRRLVTTDAAQRKAEEIWRKLK
jgi:4-hydroxy-3-polyprenylbenzoate decarboxylase